MTRHRSPLSRIFDVALIALAALMVAFAVQAFGERNQASGDAAGAQASTVNDITNTGDIPMAVEILTNSEEGPNLGRSLRWVGPQVTYTITAGANWTPQFRAFIDEGIVWGEHQSGLDLVEVPAGSNAQITIGAQDGVGGLTVLTPGAGGTIARAQVTIGCCSQHTATEELAQMLGPISDLGDGRSIFSESRSQLTPSEWDAWVVRGLYRAAPGADAEALAEALQQEDPPAIAVDPRVYARDD